MNLNLGYPWLSRLSLFSPHKFPNNNSALLYLISSTTTTTTHESSSFKNHTFSALSVSKSFKSSRASLSESENEVAGCSVSSDEEWLNSVSAAKDANEALNMIAEKTQRSGGVVTTADCCSIISAALDRNNADLALSIFSAMRSSFDTVLDLGAGFSEKGPSVERWKWSRPDVHTYTLLVRGLAASLRVSDALRMIASVCRVGVSPSEEVPFGKLVRCPTCMVAVAVAQPQHGIQACK